MRRFEFELEKFHIKKGLLQTMAFFILLFIMVASAGQRGYLKNMDGSTLRIRQLNKNNILSASRNKKYENNGYNINEEYTAKIK